LEGHSHGEHTLETENEKGDDAHEPRDAEEVCDTGLKDPSLTSAERFGQIRSAEGPAHAGPSSFQGGEMSDGKIGQHAKDHPSGRPIHRERTTELRIMRIPDDEPLTPRLRRRSTVEAIGFTTRLSRDDE
jgi:hypothetical protein